MKKLACGTLTVKAGNFDDIIKCLIVNFPKLGNKLKKYTNVFDSILIIIDDKIITDMSKINEYIRNCEKIELVPTLIFSGFITGAAVASALAIKSAAVAASIAFVANVIIVSALSFGISFLVSKLLAPKDPKQVKTSSYILNSKTNIAARNTPIPIGYGKLRVTSSVVSSYALNFDYQPDNPLNAAGTSIGYVGGQGNTPTITQLLW